MNISSVEELISFYDRGKRIKYIFFWGHQKPNKGITKSCFSQWYDSAFTYEGVVYKTAEHFMMAEKAKLFNDSDTFSKIIDSSEPGKAKRLGREIRGFSERVWVENRLEIVKKANLLKFQQVPQLKEFILNTGNRVLVEASPVDPIWGIGVASDSPNIEDPRTWKGLNLLGFSLMSVREKLQKA